MFFRDNRPKAYTLLFIVMMMLLVIPVITQQVDKVTSTPEFCTACHFHPHATTSWEQSPHRVNKRHEVVTCVECHLPPKGQGYWKTKAATGFRDLYGFLIKDSSVYNRAERRGIENASRHTFESSCITCHPQLFPPQLSKAGEIAHFNYVQNKEELRCINCHLHTGHGPTEVHQHNMAFFQLPTNTDTVFEHPHHLTHFTDFTETISGSSVSFRMIAINGGSFSMGSSAEMATPEEKPVQITVSSFFMGQIEVTWDEYLLFMQQTESEGRLNSTLEQNVDAISGATPPWGNPDQGWGTGKRPAITMTHHAAETYCQWLSQKTGKTYRLPTEAEWEYACRAGTNKDFFFLKENQQNIKESKLKDLALPYINFANTNHQTILPSTVKPNPWGLINTLGNVWEFCADNYHEVNYRNALQPLNNPLWKDNSNEYVIKGGSYKSTILQTRPSARASTQTQQWLKTDPQIPKSKWWYSDCNDVGFRVVCEIPETLESKIIGQKP
jgi:formylglycine-generating enzyme required for sulfatase activity